MKRDEIARFVLLLLRLLRVLRLFHRRRNSREETPLHLRRFCSSRARPHFFRASSLLALTNACDVSQCRVIVCLVLLLLLLLESEEKNGAVKSYSRHKKSESCFSFCQYHAHLTSSFFFYFYFFSSSSSTSWCIL